jgi:hypothetical protein
LDGLTTIATRSLTGTTVRENTSSPEAPRQLRRGATRALFVTSVLFVPAPLFIVFVVGLLPLAASIAYFVGLIAAGPPDAGALLMSAILVAHVTVDAAILYLLDVSICRLLFGLCSAQVAMSAVGIILSAEVLASFFPIYVLLLGEHDTHRLSLWRVWQFVLRLA